MNFDAQSITNWIISGLIGLVFGIISAWVTHRYERKRDDISWQHEKEKLTQQFKQEKELVEIQFQQRLLELEKTISIQTSKEIRMSLTKGLENPEKEIKNLDRARSEIRSGGLQFRLNTDEHRMASRQLMNKAQEMRSAIQNADIAMANLRTLSSPRIQNDVAQWDELKSKLISDLEVTEQTAAFLKKTADDVDAVMSSNN